ncbi:hypothetical protein VaNZ11_017028 [Volvox africanus]|uniref:Protein kinase domain-containing protein n=1 Tax=Volvox africanus TaxID=51714 RepID=A0ABQ5SQR7_9CHLO|nr:hypothetical protein VaNZ11_017028 [Volvox africanus]
MFPLPCICWPWRVRETEPSRGLGAQSEGINDDTTERPQTGSMTRPNASLGNAGPTESAELYDRSASPSEVLRQSTSLRPVPSLRQSSLLQQSTSLPSTTDRVLQSAGEPPSPFGSLDMPSIPGERLLSQQDVLSSSATAAAAVAAAAATFTQLRSLLPLHGELTQLSWIGSGSCGRVYAGLWRGSPVAVKILVSSTPDEVRDSVREALLSRVASHPHMVQCFAAFSGYITKEDMTPRSVALGPQQHAQPYAITQAQSSEHRQHLVPELHNQAVRLQAQPQKDQEQCQTHQIGRVNANGSVQDLSTSVMSAVSGQSVARLDSVGGDGTDTDVAEGSTATGGSCFAPSAQPSQRTQGALTLSSSRPAESMSLSQDQHQHGEVIGEIRPTLGQADALRQQHRSMGDPIQRQAESQQRLQTPGNIGKGDHHLQHHHRHHHGISLSSQHQQAQHQQHTCQKGEGGERQQHPCQQYGEQRSVNLWVESKDDHDRQTQSLKFSSATADCRLNPDGLRFTDSAVSASYDATPQSAGLIGRYQQGPYVSPPCTGLDLREVSDSGGSGLSKFSHVTSVAAGISGSAPGRKCTVLSQQEKQRPEQTQEQLGMVMGLAQSGPSPAHAINATRRFGGVATAGSTASAALFYGSTDDASLGQCARSGNTAPRPLPDGSVGVGGENSSRHERSSGGGFAFEKRSLSLVNMGVGGAGASAASVAAPRASSRTTLTLSDLMGSAILDEQFMPSGELWEVLTATGARPGLHCTLVIMEMCDQGTLQQLMQRQPFSAVRSAERSNGLLALLRTALEVAQGMCHLHSLDIVHGDLKPSNVLLQSIATVAPRSGTCRPWEQDLRGFAAKVADFGLAAHQPSAAGELEGSTQQDGNQLLGSELAASASERRWGSLPYMAPEVPDRGPSKKSDVWSYGMLLYYMCCGKSPYASHGKLRAVQLLLGIVQGTLTLDWPDDTYRLLRRLAETCCQRDPAARPPFSRIVLALQRLLRHVSEHPEPAAAPRRDRNRGGDGAAGGAGGGGSSGAGNTGSYSHSAAGSISLGCLDASGDVRNGGGGTSGGINYNSSMRCHVAWSSRGHDHDRSSGAQHRVGEIGPLPVGAAATAVGQLLDTAKVKMASSQILIYGRCLGLSQDSGRCTIAGLADAADTGGANAATVSGGRDSLVELAEAARAPAQLSSSALDTSSVCVAEFSAAVERSSYIFIKTTFAGSGEYSQAVGKFGRESAPIFTADASLGEGGSPAVILRPAAFLALLPQQEQQQQQRQRLQQAAPATSPGLTPHSSVAALPRLPEGPSSVTLAH